MYTINEIKNIVKSHTIIPFATTDIGCDNKNLIIHDRYKSGGKTQKIMDQLGVRHNLTKNILDKPEENWSIVRSAINSVQKDSAKLSAIVDANDNIITLIDANVSAPRELNFDERIDSLMNEISKNNTNTFKDIIFKPDTAAVNINTVTNDQIDCGGSDSWQFGTTTVIQHTNQQFSNFFLRLICTNGMTTREDISYRKSSASNNIASQFIKFASNTSFSANIKPRVDRLKNSRASFLEIENLRNALTADEVDMFMPFYSQIICDFKDKGIDIDKLSSKRKRFVYTNENAYDIFNLATNLASHQRDTLSDSTCNTLNHAAGSMFTKGPDLDFNVIDIYK